MADDEFVLGFWDSEWTGIAPMLEEDVAMSSISQDEIGHAARPLRAARRAHRRRPRRDRVRPRRVGLPPRRAARPCPHRLGLHHRASLPLRDTPDAVAPRGARRLDVCAARASWRPRCGARSATTCSTSTLWLRRLAAAGGDVHARLAAAIGSLGTDAMGVLRAARPARRSSWPPGSCRSRCARSEAAGSSG